jgi:hypothetical protein
MMMEMKRFNRLIFFGLVLAIALVGCSSEDTQADKPEVKSGEKLIDGTVTLSGCIEPQATSRTYAYTEDDRVIKFKWSAGDVIELSKNGTTFYKSTAAQNLNSDSTVATFEVRGLPKGDVLSNYKVYFNRNSTIKSGTPIAIIANGLNLPEHNFITSANGDCGYATISNGTFTLIHSLSYFAVKLAVPYDVSGNEATVNSITVSGSGVGGATTMTAAGVVTGNSSSVTYTVNKPIKRAAITNPYTDEGDGGPRVFYVMCAPKSNITITATINNQAYSLSQSTATQANATYDVDMFCEPLWEDARGLLSNIKYVTTLEAGYTDLTQVDAINDGVDTRGQLANCYVVPVEGHATVSGKYAIPLKKPDGTVVGQGGYMEFTVKKGIYGNAAVAYPDNMESTITGREKDWSWHIWVPGVNPATETITNAAGKKYTTLDMYIGALSKVPVNPTTNMAYQFGRKDPIPYSDVHYMSGHVNSVPLSSYGFRQYHVVIPTATTGTFGYAYKHPDVLLFHKETGNGSYDWVYNGTSDMAKSYWGFSTKQKNKLNDPSPAGYHVPFEKEIYSGFCQVQTLTNDKTQFNISGSWNYGYLFYTDATKTSTVWYASRSYIIGYNCYWTAEAFYNSNSSSVNGYCLEINDDYICTQWPNPRQYYERIKPQKQ